MTTLKADTLWMMNIALVLSLGASCRVTSPTQKIAPPSPLVDLSARRVGGRQTLAIAEDLVLHADRIVQRPDGVMEASGSVYLDGYRFSSPKHFTWPMHAYSDSAEWRASARSLTLTGWPVLEYRRSRITSLEAGCLITLNGSSIKSVGRTKTDISSDPKPSAHSIKE